MREKDGRQNQAGDDQSKAAAATIASGLGLVFRVVFGVERIVVVVDAVIVAVIIVLIVVIVHCSPTFIVAIIPCSSFKLKIRQRQSGGFF